MKLGIQVLLFLFCIACSVFRTCATESSLGGVAILTQPLGARQIGMGETFVAIADDLNTIYYNPSGLTQIDKELSSTYIQGMADTFYASFSFGKKINESSNFGLSMYVFQAGTFELPVTETTYKTVRIQDDYLFTGSYAIKNPKLHLSCGINLKILHSVLIEDYKATAFAGDLGLLYHLPFIKGLSFGAVVQNAGTELKYAEVGDPLPLTYRLGAAYRLPNILSGVNISVDLVHLKNSPVGTNSGTEIRVTENIVLRAGYRNAESINYYSFGFGFYLGGTGFDYSRTLNNDPGALNQTTLTFGPEAGWLFRKETEVKEISSVEKDSTTVVSTTEQDAVLPQDIILEKELSDQVEKDLIPTFILIKNGYYSEAQKELNTLLLKKPKNENREKIKDKLTAVADIIPAITEDNPISNIVRKGLFSFLKPVENPKDTIIKLRYALEKSKNKEIIKQLYVMLQNRYPDIAKTEEIPEGFDLVKYKLYKALSNIYDGYYDIAIRESKEVLELEPENVLALKRLGSACYCLGMAENNPETIEKGREIWRKGLDLSPDDKEIKDFLKEKE